MGKPTGFKEIPREMPKRRPVELRVLDWNEIYLDMTQKKLRDQGARHSATRMSSIPMRGITPSRPDNECRR